MQWGVTKSEMLIVPNTSLFRLQDGSKISAARAVLTSNRKPPLLRTDTKWKETVAVRT